ncbi:hypothetical protein Ami103574_12235 [Aminipila butyrica]|uniref:Uncharacterized protein n=1 Tax=Aminipila butyrica TaxID=433296 RepID=A0A858BY34_9FIRM|nr:hypothetical protein [Aminipila butyrica]QIB70018.1 hypothetical protein Ami103574_12235 [Aminipila butyrica]
MHKCKKALIFIVTLSLILSNFQFGFADQKLIYEDKENAKPKTNSFESKEDIKAVTVLNNKSQLTTNSSIELSDDSADGKYSLKVSVGNDRTANSCYIDLMTFNSSEELMANQFGKMKLYVKPAQNAKELTVLIDDKTTRSFKVGDRLKSGQWNEIEIDLSLLDSWHNINNVKAMINQNSVWYFDKIELKREKSFDLERLSQASFKSATAEQHNILYYGQSTLNNSMEHGKLSGIKISEDTRNSSESGTIKLKDGIISKIAEDRLKASKDGRYLYYIKSNDGFYKYDRQTQEEILIRKPEVKLDGPSQRVNSFDVNSDTQNIVSNIVDEYTPWVEVSNANGKSLGLKKDGTVWEWTLRFFPDVHCISKQIGGLTGVKSISAGPNHCLALKKDGTVWAWGKNFQGELGNGTTVETETPIRVSNLTDVVSVSAGDNFSCAVKKDGTVWIWGKSDLNDIQKLPTQVLSLKDDNIVSVCAFASYGLAFANDGFYFINGKSKGVNLYKKNDIASPFLISRGNNHLLVLDKQKNVWSFGDNSKGQLGIETTNSGIALNKITNLSNIISITAGYDTSYAIKKDGTIWEWGSSHKGEFLYIPKQQDFSGKKIIAVEDTIGITKFLTNDNRAIYYNKFKDGIDLTNNIDINGQKVTDIGAQYKVDKLQYLSNDILMLKENQYIMNEFDKDIETGIYRYKLFEIKNNGITENIISEDEYLNYLSMNGNQEKYFSYKKEQEKDENAYIISKYGVDRTFTDRGNEVVVTHTNTKGEKVTENVVTLKSYIQAIIENPGKDLLIVKTKPNTKTIIQNTTKNKTNETSTTTSSSTSTAINVPVPINQNTRVDGTKTDSESTSTTVKSVGELSPESTTITNSVQTQEKYDWYAIDVNKKTATLLNFDYDNGTVIGISDNENIVEITYVADSMIFTYRYDRLSGKIVNDESGLENVKFNIYLNTKGPDGGYLKTKLTSLKANVIDIKANSKADTAFVKLQDQKWYMVDAKTKSARELKIDLNDPEIIYVSENNKLYLYDANSRYMIFDVQTEEMKDIRPADADIDKYLVAEDGRQIIYKTTNNELKVKYLDEITEAAGQYYLLSFDGKCTFQSYKNGRWVTVPNPNNLTDESFEKYGMSLLEMNALNSEDFNKLYINDRQIYSVDVAAMIKSGAYYGSQNIRQIRCFINEDDMDSKLYGQKTYMAKEENISLDNVRKINGINAVESVNLPTEYVYFLKKGDKYLTYNEEGEFSEGDSIDSLLKDVRKNWIDLKLAGMTKAELINIPAEALTKEFLTDATSEAVMGIVYAAKLDDGDIAKYKVAFRLSTTENYFESENLKIVIQQNDGKTKEYSNLSKVQVEDFMEWVAGRQVNQGPIFYRLKSGNTNEFINYYMIVNVTVQE